MLIEEAAKSLGVSVRTVYRLVKEKRIVAKKVSVYRGIKAYDIDEDSLNRYKAASDLVGRHLVR